MAKNIKRKPPTCMELGCTKPAKAELWYPDGEVWLCRKHASAVIEASVAMVNAIDARKVLKMFQARSLRR